MPSKFETLQEETTFSLADLYGDDISPDAAKADMLAFERSMDDMLPVLSASSQEKNSTSTDALRKGFAEALLALEKAQTRLAVIEPMTDCGIDINLRTMRQFARFGDISSALQQASVVSSKSWDNSVWIEMWSSLTEVTEKKENDTVPKHWRHKTSSLTSIKSK
ncbi:hypothetical protein H5A33_14370 [Pectobacterium brasiliense]|uniref:hypothetical protein n=1 Tax=Pectobacterium brasiliense TaxID=180957 RepID=UPI00057F36B8|nr:hypothetical protein [Pectobacterium brasiliense]KHS67302.1 hypothetical protein RC77_13840 [Pectobacterium brasiliense]MBN3055422.1 hypothetical protein [Pectobacterium brasiliense]MBN3069779.1 hypothetical protein [Pectobacterium brasiliense]MBN3246827.1 hypothetical protein [Pectobacterium brasiliense]MBN3255805.1 hypothetical protein [Pectobacterium brasiliense]